MERSSFLPVVLSATGGCGKGATALLKRIAHLQASRSKEPYSVLMALLYGRRIDGPPWERTPVHLS